MIGEHEKVKLTENMPRENLKAGNIGFVVYVFTEPAGYAVEFRFDNERKEWIEHKVVNVTPEMIAPAK